jgi:hypothetical protein
MCIWNGIKTFGISLTHNKKNRFFMGDGVLMASPDFPPAWNLSNRF